MNELVSASLLTDIRSLIDEAKTRVAIKVNQEMTLLYWNIGKRIHENVLNSERAEYGEQVIGVALHSPKNPGLTSPIEPNSENKFHIFHFNKITLTL